MKRKSGSGKPGVLAPSVIALVIALAIVIAGAAGTVRAQSANREPPALQPWGEGNAKPNGKRTIKLVMSSIAVPNLETRTIDVYNRETQRFAGRITPREKSLEVPVGTYKLVFMGHTIDRIEVKSGQPAVIALGSIEIPNLHNGNIGVYDQVSGGPMGNITRREDTLQLPAGMYKLEFGAHYVRGVQVFPGKPKVVMAASIGMRDLPKEPVAVYEQNSGDWVGNLAPGEKTLDLPAGTYRIQYENNFIGGIAVAAGEEVEIEK